MADVKQNHGIQKPGAWLFNTMALSAFCLILVIGCTENQPIDSITERESEISSDINGMGLNNMSTNSTDNLLRELRRATARFHSTEQATKAGYVVASHCVVASDPELGAMGYHWLNESLLDPVFEVSKPEAVLYEPDKNGNLKLVAAEYIVIDVGQPRPYFGDYPFDIGGTPIPVPHWSLHVWLWRDNPNGIFTNYNPNVHCPD
jgi:hypothetical protein